MGCGNCGTGANGAPSGCKSNGGCSTGGCNRLNVYDWLNALPLHDSAKPYPIIEVSFSKGSRKEFFRNNTHYIIEKGTWLAVEGLGGYDIGQVSLTGELVKLQLKKYGVRETDVTKRVLHPATEEELEESVKQKNREPELLIRSRAIARSLKLEMKLCEIEIQADSKKGTFFYTADQRVDFRELIKLYAGDFKMKVEMRAAGKRQGGRDRVMRARALLQHMAHRFQICEHYCGALPEPVYQPDEAIWPMRAAQMLPELRTGYLYGRAVSVPGPCRIAGNNKGHSAFAEKGYFQEPDVVQLF